MRAHYRRFAAAGIIGITAFFALVLSILGAVIYTWWQGVLFGFHHSIVLGLVSIIPPIGFFEGLFHLIGVI